MSELLQTYDTKTGRDLLRPQIELPRVTAKGALPARTVFQAIKAYHRERNRRQNFLRWSTYRTGITSTWSPGQWYEFAFDTMHFAEEKYQGRKVHLSPLTAWTWQCGEPGIYNFKGNVTILISVPAVPFTKITRATVRLKRVPYEPSGGGLGDGYVQAEELGQVRVIPNIPPETEQIYLRGFSLDIKDKLALNAGDRITVEWKFTAEAAIGYLEEYNGHIAIQKTGEAYIDGRCCRE